MRNAGLRFVPQPEAELARAGGKVAILAHGERRVEAAGFCCNFPAQEQVRCREMPRGTSGESGRQNGTVGGKIFEAGRETGLTRSAGATGEIGSARVERV